MMDGEQIDHLIRLLKDRPALWRKEDLNFSNREVRRKLMDELSRATGFPATTITKKIKTLKDRMRICVSKLPKTKNGQPAFAKGASMPTWPHYNEMLFMKDQFLGKSLSDNRADSDSNGLDDDDPENESMDGTPEVVIETLSPVSAEYDLPITDISRANTNAAAKRRRPSSPVIKEELIEPQKPNNIAKFLDLDSKKDDLRYFMADIINDMGSVTDPYLRIQTKSKIRRIVEEAVMTQIELNRSVTMSGDHHH